MSVSNAHICALAVNLLTAPVEVKFRGSDVRLFCAPYLQLRLGSVMFSLIFLTFYYFLVIFDVNFALVTCYIPRFLVVHSCSTLSLILRCS